MTNETSISPEQARSLVLQAQGLNGIQESTLESVKRLSYVQVDTISVAARAHHHVLFSRNRSYQTQHLDELIQQGHIFEYWSHAAAFLPMDDYRFSLYRKSQIQKDGKFWFEKDQKVMRQVMRRIKKEGPLQSKDFVHERKDLATWFEWKPAKIALQLLFMEGKLMICQRQAFQKVYDLTERVLPDGTDTRKPTEKGFYAYLIDRAVASQGLVTTQEMGYLRKGSGPIIQRLVKEKVRKEELKAVRVEGNPETYYSSPEMLENLRALSGTSELYILNPFDNLVIQRKRLSDLFQFNYLIECYVPEAKRTYGYYTLPVLYGDRFVARLDPKADRKTGVFLVKHLWFEEGFEPHAEFLNLFAKRLKEFGVFCGCQEVAIGKVRPTKYKSGVLKALKA